MESGDKINEDLIIVIVRKEAAALAIGLYHWRAVFLFYFKKCFVAIKRESIFTIRQKIICTLGASKCARSPLRTKRISVGCPVPHERGKGGGRLAGFD